MTVNGISGTTKSNTVAIFQCKGVKHCSNIALDGVDLDLASNGTKAVDYVCGNMIGATERLVRVKAPQENASHSIVAAAFPANPDMTEYSESEYALCYRWLGRQSCY